METLYILGVDVSKKTLDAALTLDGKNFFESRLENTSKAIRDWFKELQKKASFSRNQLVVCMEHTGIYCQHLLDFCLKNEIKVSLESALQIKKSLGITRGKNDKVDARRIAVYALKNPEKMRFWLPQRENVQKIKALLVARERLVKVKTQLEVPLNENQEFLDPAVVKILKAQYSTTLQSLGKDIKRIEKSILQLVKDDQALESQYKLVTSVPGIGLITGLNVIVSTNEFKNITHAKRFACYSGVAPFEHTSGTSIRGKTRISKLANMKIKRLLHLAAMSAIHHSEELNHYYNRKLAEGKNKMSIVNAVRNKLITRIFSCISNKREYQKNYQNALA